MAYFRAIARKLASSASVEEDNSNTMEVSVADRLAARRAVGVASEARSAAQIPRMGSREVFLLKVRGVEQVGKRNGTCEIQRGRQRQTIHREHRSVRIQFMRHFSSEDVRRVLRTAFAPYEYVHGHRVQRATNNDTRTLLRSQTVR